MLLPIFNSFWCPDTGLQTRGGEHGFAVEVLSHPVAAFPPLCFFMVSLARNPPGDHMDPGHSTTGDIVLGVSRSISNSASNRFLRCLLFPATSAPAAHVAEFARADSTSQEGSITSFQLVFVWLSYFTYA